jgi:DUF1365 family protein
VTAPLESCLYLGTVTHRRREPVEHAFRAAVFYVSLDLAELDRVFAGRWLWSTRRPALAWLDRRLHLGDPGVPLDAAVRDLVAARLGRRPDGPIRLVTHLTYFGYGFNPVSFYYCWRPGGLELDCVVAEVNNTPWDEQYPYVLDARPGAAERHGRIHRWRLQKRFHVSPFMALDQAYDWRFLEPGERLAVHMESREGDRPIFDATLSLERRAMDGWSLAGVLLRYPAMTARVVAGIYWNALRLWWKRVPYVPHPGTLPAGGRRLHPVPPATGSARSSP